MNAMGRQMQRSSSTGHHQRQYSDNFIDNAFNNKWLRSAGLHHLQSSNSSIPPLQDFGFFGNSAGSQPQGSKWVRNGPKGVKNGGEEDDPSSTPQARSRSSSMRKDGNGEGVSPGELSHGLIDLHSFDTELVPEFPSQNDGSFLNHPAYGRSFDDSAPCISAKLNRNGRGLPENYLLKSFSLDGEKANNNVAKIKVVVRKRPLNKKEIARKEEDIIAIDPNSNLLTVYETKLKVDLTEYVEKHEFVFDAVMNEGVSNDDVYAETVQPIVPLIFQRTKATCFAYGQTGSGKTYTMQPLPLKASENIFKLMHNNYQSQGFQLFVSFFEIYGGKVFDLLNDRKKLCMREDGKQQVCIVGLQEYKVSSVETVKELIERGNATRSTGTTGANEESSRSHAILQLAIKRKTDGNDSKPARAVGKLSFIDLAGSERGADTTDNDKQTRMEGAEINKSLLALKECIRALDNDQGHIPFRGSKLTEVLRDSFVGDSRTVMISCISPNSGSCEHTLNTLRYADRVKSLSKGNSSKREPLSLLNLRSSIAVPSSTALPSVSGSEDNAFSGLQQKELGKLARSKAQEKESSLSSNIERVPSGRMQSNLAPNPVSSAENLKQFGTIVDRVPSGQSRWNAPITRNEEDFHSSGLMHEQEYSSQNLSEPEPSILEDPDNDLAALLKEEGDLVNFHRKQVEDTMDIVKEEMNLLVQIDQPGNQLDDYITRLNLILSQKAAGILKLQNRLADFQKHLQDRQVFVFPANP
ncbi:OLC1v1037292C1 [Oldenlandia corymbosa var. corymbosa]|uniref:Kinesin-like protein n=1 Tax=Oldenlandia corymbosa var. corymbosa TaxID=529605 RepID=A0AAV1CXF5_OLDCO|nr:OLC1v1037292C1 [Oldenlandia corymbosa var. corymbosa]